jgi:RNA-directed DNA polymerase
VQSAPAFWKGGFPQTFDNCLNLFVDIELEREVQRQRQEEIMQRRANYSSSPQNFLLESIIEEFLSPSNFERAWQKVKSKQGSAGLDGETLEDFGQNLNANLLNLRESVLNSTYQPFPYKQTLIPKSKGSCRELRIPAVRDRIVQQALLNVLGPILENQFSSASFAYRPNLSYLDAVKAVARWRDLGFCWVMDADIVQYFNSIDHQILLEKIREFIDFPGFLWLIKSWLIAGVVTDQRQLIKTDLGIPQGAVVSPLLANLYLNEFDYAFANSEVKLVRYADDFVLLGRSREQISHAGDQVNQILASLKLSLHSEKTQITNFERGFRFLGHGFLENAIFPL